MIRTNGKRVLLLAVLVALSINPKVVASQADARTGIDFTMSIAPTDGNVFQGDGITATVFISTEGEWEENEYITFSATGLPRGAYIEFAPENLCPAKNQFSLTMTIGTSLDTPLGAHEIAVNATLENVGKVRSKVYTLSVMERPDFSINIAPSEAELVKGGSTTAILKVTPSKGYSGNIHLSVSGTPSGVDVGLTPSTGVPPFDSIITIRVLEDVESGTYPIAITASSVDKSCATLYELHVKPEEEPTGVGILDRLLLAIIAVCLIVAAAFVSKR